MADDWEEEETSEGRSADKGSILKLRIQNWILLTGNRLVLGAGLLLVVAGAVWGLVLAGLAPLDERTPILYLLFALISGNFALITIVVSLSQFVLSRHLESPDEIRERMNEMVGYRRDVGESTHRSVLPVTTGGFLSVLFQNIGQQARDLGRVSSAITEDRTFEGVADLSTALSTHAEEVVDILETSGNGPEDALFATLETSYATYIHTVWHLQSEHVASLPDEASELLARLELGLEHVDVARRVIKTVFIQSELASLSRLLLYVGLPVQLGTVVIMLLFTATSGIGVAPFVLSLLIPVIVTLGFVPFVLLAAYIVRLATVAERTASMYPFADSTAPAASLVGERWGDQPSPDGSGRPPDDSDTD